MTSRISQDLFDETVLENEEVFELSPEEALKETFSQYSQLDLSHLVLSHPSNDSSNERHECKLFLEALDKLNDCVQEDGSVIVDEKCTVQWLETVARLIKTNPKRFLVLLHQQEAMYTLLSLFTNYNDIPHDVLIQMIQTLLVISTPTTRLEIQSQLRDFMGAILPQWMKLFTTTSENDDDELQSLLLQLAYVSCYSNEDNKKQWVKAATMSNNPTENGIDVLLDIFKQDNNYDSMVHACQLLTTLCRFDDFRTPTNTNTPIVSSANEHVLEFARHQAVPILFSVARNHIDDARLLAATLSALRVLAIHDNVVQSMVAVGVLDFCATLLQQPDNATADILSATLGLIRNLSANDDVKTTLCNDTVLSGMMHAMQQHLQHASLQEHACATMAAMALRKPQNAQRIVQLHHGHVCIVTAMRQHSNKVLVQRQGALALRNLASRSNNDIRQVLLDAGAQVVLRQAGQQHQSCVDEAYAALRDLGCNVKLMKLDKEGKAVERTVMFGETKPNFRPVLEESSNDAKHNTSSD